MELELFKECLLVMSSVIIIAIVYIAVKSESLILKFVFIIALILLISFIMNSCAKEKESQYLHISEAEEYKQMSKNELKDSCIPFTKEIMRNESKNIGKMVSIELNIVSDDVDFIGHDYEAISMNEEISDKFILKYTENKDEKLLKNDKIRVYGIYNGEYTSIDGKDNGQSITIVDYEFIDKA